MKKTIIYNFLLTGSNLLFPLLIFPYLSRILGAEGLGVCNFIISYGQNFMIIAALGLPIYGTREIAKAGNDKMKRSKLFFELLSVHLFFTIFLLLFYTLSIFLYSDLKIYKDIALLGGSLIFFNVFLIEWLFTGVNDFKYITIRSLFVRALSLIFIFIFVKKKDDFIIYFIILACTVLLTTMIDLYYARKFITRKISLSFKGVLSHIKPIIVLGVYIVITSIYSILPTTLLGFFSTKAAVGYYYGANRIIRMVISFFTALTTVLIPRLNQVFEEKGEKEYLILINKSLNVVISFGIPVTFFVFLFANPIVRLLAGDNFTNSILLVQVMAPIILIVAFAQIFVLLILSVHRKDGNMVFLSVTGMLISLIINLIFIPHFAEKATAVSQLTAESLVTFISFILAKRVSGFDFPVKRFFLNLVMVIPFALIAYISSSLFTNTILYIVFSGILCGVYFLIYQLFILKDSLLLQLEKSIIGNLKISIAKNRLGFKSAS